MKQVILNGKSLKLAPDTRIVLSRQSNNLTKPDSIQADFSQTFTAPHCKENQALSEYADEIPSTTSIPYQQLKASIIGEGGVEIVPNGVAELLRTTDQGYEYQIFSGNINLFDALGDKKLADLELSAFNHNWNIGDISTYMANTAQFTYLLLDIGQDMVLDAYPAKFMYPATYAVLLWEKIFQEAGFQFVFSYPSLFPKLLLPSTKPPQYSKEWTDARSYRGYVPQTAYEAGDQSNNRNTIVRWVPFSQTDILPYFDSKKGTYNKATNTFTADEAMRIDLSVNTFVYLKASIGAAQAKLTIYVNGQVADRFHNDPSEENGEVVEHEIKTTDVQGRNNEMALNVHVSDFLLQAGDTVRIRVELKGNTNFNKWGFRLYHRWPSDNLGGTANGIVTTGMTAEQRQRNSIHFQVKNTFPEGGRVNLSNWLPDMSQKDFVKAIIKLFGLTVQSDNYENRIQFNLFAQVLANRSIAKNWSHKIDYSKRPEIIYTFGDFAQASQFNWKADETVTAGLGDGVIWVDNQNLPATKAVIEMPFAASDTKGVAVIPVFKKEVTEEGVTFSDQAIEPRLIVRTDIKQDLVLKENDTVLNVKSWGSYFVNGAAPYDLDFDRYLIPNFYGGYQAILKQVKYIRVYVKLTEQEYYEFDQLVPVWVEKWGAYFYVNLISQWESSEDLCLVELIRLTEL